MKILFIGLGSIGQRHLRNIIQLLPTLPEILAVRRIKKVPFLNEKMEINGTTEDLINKYNILEFENIDLALNNNPDLVYITNPSIFHITNAKLAMKNNCSIFIEKPLSSNWEGVEDLLNTNSKNKNRTLIGYQFRFHPAMKEIKSILEKKLIGNLVSANFVNGEYLPFWHPYEDYRQSYAARNDLGGGALVTQIHEFDLAAWFFGPPESIYAVGGKLSDLDINVEDSVIILMRYLYNSSSIPVSIQLDYLRYPSERSVSIVGDRGTIYWNSECNDLIVTDNKRLTKNIFSYLNFSRNKMFIDLTKHFLEVNSGSISPIVSIKEAAISLKMALAAKHSILARCEVNYKEFKPY
ncbi:MAG: Gfo/Idh/MocA family oxidoreductase [Bifidobacteriaceae bacterium]|jgi:predicted dehydrogenase|nr:Gfo/Idh/MocA family oxidoreductase [Bifidobacteriaceae bacterium]